MNYTLEQIDELRLRANVSYEEAKAALDQCNGDTLEALIYLEKQNKTNSGSCCGSFQNDFVNSVKGLIKKGNETKFVIKKDEKTVLNVPVSAAVVTAAFAAPAAVVGVAAAIFTDHKIKIEKPDGEDSEINKVFDQMSDVADTVKDKINIK